MTLCNIYNIDYKYYQSIIDNIPYLELKAKLNYLKENNFPIIVNNNLNRILTISEEDLIKYYGLDTLNLIREYAFTKVYTRRLKKVVSG